MRRALVTSVVAGLIAASMLLVPPPASAALSNTSLVASNNQVSATNVTLTIAFQVGAIAESLVVGLPAGITGLSTANTSVTTSSDGTSYSSPTLDGGAPKLLSGDGDTVAINLDTPLAVGDWVTITITGLTNPSSTGGVNVTVGNMFAVLSQVALDALDLATGLLESATIVFTIVSVLTNGVSNAVGVAPTLTMSVVGGSSHSWSLDPSGTASSTASTDVIRIGTNAVSYVLQAKVSGDLIRAGTTGADDEDRIDIDAASNVAHFGYKVTAPSGDTTGVNSSTVRQWSTSYADLVSGWSLSGLTNEEDTTVTYDILIDYTKAPGSYTATVTYRVVPTY